MKSLQTKRAFVVLATILIISTMVTQSMADTSLWKKSDDNQIIDVEKTHQDQESIEWEITFNKSAVENEGANIKLELGDGLSKSSIASNSDAEIRETVEGYEVSTPTGSDSYKIDLITKVGEQHDSYELRAIATLEDTQFEAYHKVEAIENSQEDNNMREVEGTEKSQEDKEVEKVPPESTNEIEAGEQQDNKETLSSTESNKKTDKNADTSTSQEDQLKEEPNESKETKRSGLPTINQSKAGIKKEIDAEWPNPGSLKLTKDAEATDTYAEWEIELTVQGKDLATTSDIVLVLDISSSMERNNRFENMLVAASNLVETVMTGNSNARVALVEFDRDPNTRLEFSNNKNEVLRSINGMKMGSGTNIQGGIYFARQLLQQSDAEHKTIVLLSDGSPNRSYRASSATPHVWPENRYDFRLHDFDYSRIRSDQDYRVDGYRVKDHVIGTISEAQLATDSGYTMYSIGLEVTSSSSAIYTISNSQNAGYYPAESDNLVEVFNQIASKLTPKRAAEDAVVIDPIGEMFNLVKDGSYNGENFEASHGTVTWDDKTETINWNIGDIDEDELYSLKYKVTIDWEKNPKGEVPYPTNGETLLNYKDPNENPQSKHFPIPKEGIDKGKITKKGYRVNVEGKPVDKNGNVVDSPSEAEQFYEVFYKKDGHEELKFYETYTIPAESVRDYTLHVGNDPTNIELDPNNPNETVWFGYIKTTDLIAGDVTAKYIDENGNEIATSEVFQGNIGDTYTTEQKDIPGYEFLKVDENGSLATGKFKKEPQTVTYLYKKKLGTLTVIKIDENEDRLAGAEFELRNVEGEVLSEAKTSNEDGVIKFQGLEWGKEYVLVETKAPEGYRLLSKPIEIEITKENLNVEKEIQNLKIGWDLPKTGGIGTILFYGLGIILMVVASLFLIKRKKTND